jgi:hypothetical protein
MSCKNSIERFDNSKICFNISVRGDTNRGGGDDINTTYAGVKQYIIVRDDCK